MYIIAAILAFGILIFVHEGGHFLTAKLFDVKVNEFALGMGPKILKKQGKETLYTLRLLPIGGFCAMEGEDEDTGDSRAFTAKAPWKRAVILCAGAAMNFLVGFLMILCISSMLNLNEPIVQGFMEGCPYQGTEGFQVGDRIVSVDGHRTFFLSDVTEYLSEGTDDVHRFVLRRDGKRTVLENYRLSLLDYPQEDGTTVRKYGFYFAPREFGLRANLRYAWMESLDFVRLIWRSLRDLVTGAVGVRELSGPVGVVDYVNEVETQTRSPAEAFFFFFYIFALIAVNLAVMNLLPVPALDGGRVFFLLITWLIESVTRKKLDPKYEGYVHAAGFVLLMGFMVLVMFNDVAKILTGR